MKLTMVIPTYNEVENLSKLSESLFALAIDNLNILIIDDDSPDGTGKLADELALKYKGRYEIIHRSGKMGLGTAYIEGFQYAISNKSEIIGQMDADFSHPVDRIPLMIEALTGSDAVIGSRYVDGGSLDEQWPAWRKGLSVFGNFYARSILGLPVRDVTGGFRLWRRETLMHMPLNLIRSNGYAFQVETTFIAHRLGFHFNEVPIHFADRRWGASKMSFRIQREAALRVWQMLIQYRHLQKDQTSPAHYPIQH